MIGLAVGVAAVWWADGTAVRSMSTGLTRYAGVVVADEDAPTVDVLGGVDGSVPLDGHDVPASEALSALIERACRVGGPAGSVSDTLVIVHPPHWGPVRCGVLSAAGRPHAREVRLADSAVGAVVAAAGASPCAHDGGCRAAVLDRTPARVTLSTVVAEPTSSVGPVLTDCRLLVPSVVVDDVDVDAALTAALREVTATLSICRVVVHGPADVLSTDSVAELAAVPVIEVEDGSLAVAARSMHVSTRHAGVVPTDPAGDAAGGTGGPRSDTPIGWDDDLDAATPRRGAWLADRVAAARPANRHRPALRIGAGVAALLAAAAAACALVVLWPVGTPSAVERVVSPARTAAPAPVENRVTPTSEPAPTSDPRRSIEPPAPTGTPFRVGALGVSIPAGWHLQPGPDRVELRPDDGAPMRILLVVREIDAGLGLDEIEAELDAVSEGSRQVHGVHRTEGHGRQQLEYLESAPDGTTAGWTVFAARGEQISVGCQGGPGTHSVLTPVCDALLAGLSVQ
ncbi:type VII secretion-associated protein [Rhodococcus kroppenstedtii]|uniref:type VII secretion-associated protein n=1 Tax=Rhodococcoides kroppenstedtii TaxID=293050 RepID=UPI002954C78E|nr:type VII secretion-associated protein [Rhodococcus kroppenstedtii]MDV7197535.1 type VII secretion-associated protein [Rhodococcus kroppenstedtii]